MADNSALIAQLAALANGQQSGLGAPLEYSISEASYMPPDVGSMGAGFNAMQDALQMAENPLVLMLLGLASGEQFGQVENVVDEGSDEGARYLQGIVDRFGSRGTSYEAFLADQILYEGASPSEAVMLLDSWIDTKIATADGGETTIKDAYFAGQSRDDIRDLAFATATDYAERLASDRPRQVEMVDGEGLKLAKNLGLGDPNEQFSLADMNPNLVPAAEQYQTAQSAYRDAKQDYRMASKPERLDRLPSDTSSGIATDAADTRDEEKTRVVKGFLGDIGRFFAPSGPSAPSGMSSAPDERQYNSASQRHLNRVNAGRERRNPTANHDAEKYAAMKALLPDLARAQQGLQYNSGQATARKAVADARGLTPASQNLRAMLSMLGGAATGGVL